MTSDLPVRLLRDGAIAHLEIVRGASLNTINLATMAAFETHLDALEADAGLGVVVLSSEGDRSFVAGGDLAEFRAFTDAETARTMSRRMADVLHRFERLPAVVIAAVEGFAFGGGCEMLLACDLVLAAPKARFGLAQVRFALTPGWGAGVRLVHRIGRAKALDLLLRGPTLTAVEALGVGLIDEIVDNPLAAARKRALQFPLRNPALIAAIKAVVSFDEADGLEANVVREREIFVQRWMSEAHFAAVEAFFEE
ncbi:MAG: hypothetical protein AUK47_09300 [Deltaproteobacteria bacterium CG2_30_63_29]|nr:MAG: hypothetical protein AUK47_09300 [Deltaproteobacteria bacterium CG2_30_63_29]